MLQVMLALTDAVDKASSIRQMLASCETLCVTLLWQLVYVVCGIRVCCVISAPLFESRSSKSSTFVHMLQLVFSCVPSPEDKKLLTHQPLSLQALRVWFHVSEPLVIFFGRSFLDANR